MVFESTEDGKFELNVWEAQKEPVIQVQQTNWNSFNFPQFASFIDPKDEGNSNPTVQLNYPQFTQNDQQYLNYHTIQSRLIDIGSDKDTYYEYNFPTERSRAQSADFLYANNNALANNIPTPANTTLSTPRPPTHRGPPMHINGIQLGKLFGAPLPPQPLQPQYYPHQSSLSLINTYRPLLI